MFPVNGRHGLIFELGPGCCRGPDILFTLFALQVTTVKFFVGIQNYAVEHVQVLVEKKNKRRATALYFLRE